MTSAGFQRMLADMPFNVALLGTLYEEFLDDDVGSRKKSGSYYTPPFVVRKLIDNALRPALEDHLARVEALPVENRWGAMLDFRVVDPAMGCGYFLVDALDAIAERMARFAGVDAASLRSSVMRHCIYGIDCDSTAVDIAKLSLSEGQNLQCANALTDDWHLRFPDVFLRENPGFDVVLSNPPWEEAVIERLQYWSQHFPGLRSATNAEQQRRIDQLEKEHPSLFERFETYQEHAKEQRAILNSGAFPGMGTGDPDLYKAFLWQIWRLCRNGGSCGVVAPRSAFSQSGASEWRREVLLKSQSTIFFLRNQRQWIFAGVNPGYDIAVAVIRKKTPASLSSYGPLNSLEEFERITAGESDRSILDLVSATDPEYLCVPMLDSGESLALFSQIAAHPGVGSRSRDDFVCAPVTELHATNDGKRLFTTDEADHPVYNHLNVGHFRFYPEDGAFAHAKWLQTTDMLQARRLRTPATSILTMMPDGWITDPATLPARNTRLVFRDVIHATNPRKVWVALAPPNALLTNKAPYLVFAKGDVSAQAYALGLLNSSILDWYAHHRVVLTLNFFIFNALPVPRMTPNPIVHRLIDLAGGLAVRADASFGAWSERFAPIDDANERREAHTEIEALAALIYGVHPDLLPLVFNRPSRPALDSVLQYYRKHEDASAGVR